MLPAPSPLPSLTARFSVGGVHVLFFFKCFLSVLGKNKKLVSLRYPAIFCNCKPYLASLFKKKNQCKNALANHLKD